MKYKPDWYWSRTFWAGIITQLALILGPEAAPWLEVLQQALPGILIALGLTERKNAASAA